MSCFDVGIRTQQNGKQNSWTIGTCKSNKTYASYRYHKESCCLAPGNHELTFNDSAGDGWEGGFTRLEDKMYCADFITGHNQRHKIDILGNRGIPNKTFIEKSI